MYRTLIATSGVLLFAATAAAQSARSSTSAPPTLPALPSLTLPLSGSLGAARARPSSLVVPWRLDLRSAPPSQTSASVSRCAMPIDTSGARRAVPMPMVPTDSAGVIRRLKVEHCTP